MNKVEKYSFLLWGVGNDIELFRKRISKVLLHGIVVGIVDTDIRRLIPLKEEYDVVATDCVIDIEFDYIVVMPQRPTAINNIMHHSSYIGIPKDKIIHYSIFEFGFDSYMDLKK